MNKHDRFFVNPGDALSVSCREYLVRVHGPGSVPVCVWTFAPRGTKACIRALEWARTNWFRDSRELHAKIEETA